MTDPDLNYEDTETVLNEATPAPDSEWWEQFQATMSLYQLQEMQKMKLRGDTNEEILHHFKSKQISEEEAWLRVIQLAERERKILEKENRAARKHQKQLEAAHELASRTPEELWQDQFTCNE